MQKTSKPVSSTANPLNQLENLLDLYLGQKAPALPANIKEMIVNFAPWLVIIAIIFSAPAILAFLGLGAFLSSFGHIGGYRYGFAGGFSLLVLALSLILEAIAVPGLFKRTARSWRLVYYACLINAVYSLIHFNLGSLIIGIGLSLYILFQIKKYYTA